MLMRTTVEGMKQFIHTALHHQTISLPLVGERIPTRMESNEDGVISELHELDRLVAGDAIVGLQEEE